MSFRRKKIASLGERHALDYLIDLGMQKVSRNWRCRAGEIDLILIERNELVFVEVKTRIARLSAERYLFENIDARKKRKLRTLVEIYLLMGYSRTQHPPVRIDVVGVLLSESDHKVDKISHIRAAI